MDGHWIELAILVLGIISSLITRFLPALPKKIDELLKCVGGTQAVIAVIEEANALEKLTTSQERQAYVAKKIKAYLEAETGKPVSDSSVNLLVEWCYKYYKDKTSK